jgi:hypothetical protein
MAQTVLGFCGETHPWQIQQVAAAVGAKRAKRVAKRRRIVILFCFSILFRVYEQEPRALEENKSNKVKSNKVKWWSPKRTTKPIE